MVPSIPLLPERARPDLWWSPIPLGPPRGSCRASRFIDRPIRAGAQCAREVPVRGLERVSTVTTQDLSQISTVRTADAGRAVATLTTAFSSDPIVRWVWPDAAAYLDAFPRLVDAMAGGALDHGTADAGPEIAGVGLWLPPGVASDEETMVGLFEETVLDGRQAEVFEFLGQMGEHHPTDTHWYLPLIGVDPSQQGRGIGSSLMRHAVARCDQDRLPAYLEATSERNKALYAQHGFDEIATIQVPSSPPMWPMLRQPR